MKNKCETCGYRFKSDDETICPECLSARDTDVDCGNLHEHSENTSYVNNSQYDYGYNQQPPKKKSGNKGCIVAVIVFVAFILLIVVLPIIIMAFEDMEDYSREEITKNVSYGETIEADSLQLKFSEPYLTDYPDKLPEHENYKVLAVDISIKNPAEYNGEYYSYKSFPSYNIRIFEIASPEEDENSDDFKYNHSWSPISYNGLFENQFPGNIYVYPETEFEYTLYYDVPAELDEYYLQFETSDYFGGQTIYTTFKFPVK